MVRKEQKTGFHTVILLVVLLMLGFASNSTVQSSPIEFTSNFEGGNGENFREVSPDNWEFDLVPDNSGDILTWLWFYFKVTNDATPRNITVKSVKSKYQPNHIAPVYSFDKDAWYYFDKNDYWYDSSSITMKVSLAANMIKYIAYCIPYNNSDCISYINSLSSPYLTKVNLGKSADNRDIWCLKIAEGNETGKSKILINADIHAIYEAYSSIVAEGIVNWLLSDDSYAQKVRQNSVWYIVPMINPDGTYYGKSRYGYGASNVDLASKWGSHDSYNETKAVWDFLTSIGGANFLLDIHSMNDGGNGLYTNTNQNITAKDALRQAFYTRLNPDHRGEGTGGIKTILYDADLVSDCCFTWEVEQRIHSRTGTPLTIDNLHEQGELVAKAISDYYVGGAELSYPHSIPIYQVHLEIDRYFLSGSYLITRFYGYNGIYQGNVTVWNGTTPTSILLSKNVSHPLGLPVEAVTLMLTYKNGTTISTIASFTMRRSNLTTRLAELDSAWLYASPSKRTATFKEIVDMDMQWPYAPP